MAVTQVNLNDPLAVGVWAKMLNTETSKALPIAPLMGKGKNSVIQVLDMLGKSAGDSVTSGLRVQLMGDGVSEGQTLEGNEEALQFMNETVRINELSHAVRVKYEGTIDQQRVLFNMRTEAKDGLVDWYADRLSLMFFIQATGYTAPWIHFEGRTITLKPVHYGFNAPLEPSKLRVIRPAKKKTDEELTKEDTFTLDLIDKAVERAKLANPRLRPVRVEGKSAYVMYLHPTQVTQLRTNTQSGQWLDITKAAYEGSRSKNPIFDGSLGMYNGVILREAEHVPNGVNSKTGEPLASVRRAVLLGAQSVIMAYGRAGNGATGGNGKGATRYKLVEELFDYQREFGVAAKTIIGMKKSRYVLPHSDQGGQDFGTIVIPSFAEIS
ncbi:N4-gp56 family major capsid protein [Bartonella massiliensis]|uniref:N4-gp56 family major capsid protein n=1 Tax=Bartonella massiliensis TaxID=929795 RepID=UPI00115961FD|nr:N4-gp56 family major capsid protein [Bartonella massiliensis]